MWPRLQARAASVVLVSAFVGLTAGGVQPALLAPFAPAISVFGSVMLFLSLLIISSQPFRRDYRRSNDRSGFLGISPWVYANLLMVFFLLALNVAGRTLGLIGMANTSTTFVCLWLLEKYGDLLGAAEEQGACVEDA